MSFVKADRNSARVTFPPPFIYLGGLLVGTAIDWLSGLLLFAAPAWLYLIAAGLAVCGFLAVASSIRLFDRLGTDAKPWKESSTLVIQGAYRWTRNPMYLGMALIYAGLAIFFRSGTALILLVVILTIVRTQVIAREELYLEARFGKDYLDYKKRVRRWI